MASERRQPVQMAQSLQKEVIQTAFDDEQSLESKTDQHQVNKIDSDTAGSKQEKCDEISNEMKSVLIKICWTKGFFKKKKHTTSRSSRTDEVLAEQRCSSSRGCQYSHIPMTVNQELLSYTKHVQEQKGAITLTLFGPPRDIDKTTFQQPQRVGALP